ncbi:uncharacterized protein G2W53_017200 [Senna tora]|uniref:Uncharacterized protein n=1 Tax=Senna tora TaxID=362788 RepID=A0A834TSC5_9FABA|nr:uncharacterized protein G2W53_017200 [Senna tora]
MKKLEAKIVRDFVQIYSKKSAIKPKIGEYSSSTERDCLKPGNRTRKEVTA